MIWNYRSSNIWVLFFISNWNNKKAKGYQFKDTWCICFSKEKKIMFDKYKLLTKMGIMCRGWTLFYFLAYKNVPRKKKKKKSACMCDEPSHLILVYVHDILLILIRSSISTKLRYTCKKMFWELHLYLHLHSLVHPSLVPRRSLLFLVN